MTTERNDRISRTKINLEIGEVTMTIHDRIAFNVETRIIFQGFPQSTPIKFA